MNKQVLIVLIAAGVVLTIGIFVFYPSYKVRQDCDKEIRYNPVADEERQYSWTYLQPSGTGGNWQTTYFDTKIKALKFCTQTKTGKEDGLIRRIIKEVDNKTE